MMAERRFVCVSCGRDSAAGDRLHFDTPLTRQRGGERTHRVCSRVLVRCTLFAMLLFHCFKETGGFEAHISTQWPGDMLVVNGSMGHGWSYHVDLTRSRSALPFLQLDSSTGAVYWKGGVHCSRLRNNPVRMHIVSQTWQQRTDSSRNKTVIPYSVFVHGCKLPHRTLKYNRWKKEQIHHIIIRTNRTASECIPPLTTVLHLADFLPQAFLQCQLGVDLPASSPLTIHSDNSLVVSSSVRLCFTSDNIPVDFTLSVWCDSFQMFEVPFRLSIQPKLAAELPRPRRSRRAVNNRPRFNPTEYTQTVKEEQPPGVQVITVTATDSDTEGAGTITYSMIASRDERSQSMFAINPLTGTINTTKKLDREFMTAHYFSVIATDHGVPPESASATLTVIVGDVNDHSPTFEPQVYSIDSPENQEIGVPVLTLRATDKDFGENSDIRYSIVNPESPNDAFMIDPIAGAISTMKRLDREARSNYTLLVQAIDQGEPKERRSSTATVMIQITDENDNAPEFSKALYKTNISEDQAISSSVPILQVSATDQDEGENARIRYALSGNNYQTFSINSITGEVFLVEPLDFENVPEYSLTVRAEDQGTFKRRSTASLHILVIDVNDNAPMFISDRYEGVVSEDSDPGNSILQVQAVDADSGQNAQLTYTILSASGSENVSLPLVIDPESGWIRTNGLIDREHRPDYTFMVRAVDNGNPQLSATTSVSINVRDINDNAPIFQNRIYQAAISEEANIGEEVVRVSAIDLDEGENARVRYDITAGNDGDAFQMNQNLNQGVITVKRKLDARQQNRYILTVTAMDTGGRKDTVQVVINVTDTNRYTPEFQGTPFSFSVDENTPVGTSVYRVRAIDRDRGENARITYSIDPSVLSFRVDPNNGTIFTHAELDRESMPMVRFSVTATDNGVPQMMDTKEVDVTINDLNDNRPEFTEIIYDGHISEDALPGEKVIQISAKDFDKGLNGQLFYTFDGGSNGNGDFSIDSARGWILVAQALDRERIPNYELVAFAVDRGTPPQSSSVIIRIKVDDVNDNHPRFESDELEVFIAENSPVGSTVAEITATDPDEGTNALVEYSFAGGPDVDSFQLSGRKGQPAIITTLIPLDYESEKKRYMVVLRAASDTQFSTAKVYINVRDVNDNAPVLKDFSIIVNNYGGGFPTGPIGRIPAFDPDVSDQELLRYDILSGNDAGLLQYNNSTGEITLDPLLNSDVPRDGTFLVSVSDSKNTVKATCRLYVRLVTPEMLHDSVTIRLDRMTQTAFLSSLMKYFTMALSTIFNTDSSNIFIINVENDTDVAPAQILNVSVSVRRGSVSVQGRTKDVFYSPEYLREYIYLYRSLLANLSALHVLPFDDNLCLQEPCASFSVCMSMVRRGEPRPFIASDTVLFRPIHPDNGYKCVCPHGFAGKDQANNCDVEVDLCYSMPCQNNGTCIPHESGYTCRCTSQFYGKNCEVNMTTKYDAISCPQEFCRSPSVCVPLSAGGFRCDGCPDDENYDQFCRLRTRNFRTGSYLTFPSLKMRNQFTIRLKFATQEKNGLLFYNGRFNEEHDFLGLEIIDSQVSFKFSLGDNHTHVDTYVPGGVSTGKWMEVTLHYHAREATLTVGEDCDTNIAIKYGDQLGNYSCAARVVHELPDICDNPTKNCHRLLDLTGPLQVGGLPWAPSTGQVTQKDFVGCISDVYIDGQLLDLNTSIVNYMTSAGCPQKRLQCQNSPCTLGGTCREGWTTFTCDCPEKAGGKDCSQEIETSRQLRGNGYLSFSTNSLSQATVHHSNIWHNGIAFRTRASSGTLMQVILNTGQVRMKLEDGYIQYTYEDDTVMLDSRRVNDGQWHYVVARWNQGRVDLELDYGQYVKSMAMQASVSGSEIQIVYVGGYRDGNGPITDGFVGCVKDIRVGINSVLANPQVTNAEQECNAPDLCANAECGPGSCVDLWGDHECVCPPGTIGPQCENICNNYNPCENWAECRQPQQGQDSYTCECGSRQSGRYCENMAPLECPAAWWGNPVCGPCDCDPAKGFESKCDKKNGTCFCKELHYRPSGSDKCFPCDCYSEGSVSMTCDPSTGQCPCKTGIIGRRCDQCDNIFAGIDLTTETCKILSYDDCPRNFAKGIWWLPVPFGETAVQDCPEGASGTAKRACTKEHSWLEADLSNCTSDNFTKLQPQLEDFQRGNISPFSADLAIELLKNATNTTSPLYGGDVVMTLLFAKEVLEYERTHEGLQLISQQYRDFIQQLVIALSNVSSLENAALWPHINDVHNGAAMLLYHLEEYLKKIITVMLEAKSGPFEAVSDGIVLGADWMNVYNVTGRPVPKYDNNVNKGSADDYANIQLPASLFSGGVSTDTSSFGYAVYHTMGKLVEMNADSSVRRTGLPLTVNGPMFTFVVKTERQTPDSSQIRLKLASPQNRTNLQCATYSSRQNLWSASDCSIADEDCRVMSDSDKCQEVYITCKCKFRNQSTYAVIIDLEDGSAFRAAVVDVSLMVYIFVGISLALLLVAFFILISYKILQSNWNSIHINLIFVIMITELAFAVGINRTHPELFCRLVAISLHYFYMAAFAWLYVEVLHIYRMLTEKHTINYGSMKFYYLLGYVMPGIIVGLAVGLYTDGYGNDSFCWLETSQLFIWSFAGPIVVVVVINIITFMFAVKASCREKVSVADISSVRLGLMGAILLLQLLSVTWVLGLLSVNFDIPALGYVHAIFVLLQGACLFCVYILISRKVRRCLKGTWYRLQGKKLDMDENLAGTRSSVMSRSALAYRNDGASSSEGGLRVNVGISTTSTTSQSSKSTGRYGPPRYKDDFGRSTSSSTSGGHIPSAPGPPNTGIAPYGYDPSAEPLPEDEYERESPTKRDGNDSDSDSDASVDRNSLDLASSHSSDEDDDFELGPPWDKQIPKSQAVAQAHEQLEKHKKEKKERERLGNNNSDQPWVDSGQVDISMDLDPPLTSRPHISSVPPDVTLSANSQRTGRKVTIVPPVRSDSLQNNYPSSSNVTSEVGTSGPISVQVLTHNGSLSSDSESSDETNV